MIYKIVLNEDSFTRLMNNINKQNDILSAEYVAHRSNLHINQNMINHFMIKTP